MSLHDDLLAVATDLAALDTTGKPRQATLRRAISTAYYALFHLLLDAAASSLVVGSDLRSLVTRAFTHADMKTACKPFASGGLPPHLTTLVVAVPADLQTVADTFVKLQEARHDADYNRGRRFRRQEVLAMLANAQTAFQCWERVRTSGEAKVFLAALLLVERWKR